MHVIWTILLVCGQIWALTFADEETTIGTQLQGCVTAQQAKRLNEAITRMLEATPYVELITTFANNLESQSMDRAEQCLKNFKVIYEVSKMAMELVGRDGSIAMQQFEAFKDSQLTGFKNAYDKVLQPLIFSAERIESLITQGNERRLLHLDVISKFRDIWLNLRRIRIEQEKAYQAFHPDLKDAVLTLIAETGQQLRKSQSTDRGRLHEIKKKLTSLEENQNALLLIKDYSTTMAEDDALGMYNNIWTNYIFSQMEIAIRKTKIENSISREFARTMPDAVQAMECFSELQSSKAIKASASIHRDCLTVGEEEAKNYVNSVNTTVEGITNAFIKMGSVSSNVKCLEVRKLELISAQLLLGAFQALHTLAPNINAVGYRSKVYDFHEKNILPALTANSMREPIRFILKIMPSRRSLKIEESYNYLDGYVKSQPQGFDPVALNQTLEQVALHVERLKVGFRCNRKLSQFIGNVVFGCKEGRNDVNGLYNEHIEKSGVNSIQCKDLTFLNIPSREQIVQLINTASKSLQFNSDCQQNKQSDSPGQIYFDDHFDYLDDEDDVRNSERLSATQRFMVCNLRKKSKPMSVIAGLISVSERLVGAVRCKKA